MAQINARNIPDDLYHRVRLAAANGSSHMAKGALERFVIRALSSCRGRSDAWRRPPQAETLRKMRGDESQRNESTKEHDGSRFCVHHEIRLRRADAEAEALS